MVNWGKIGLARWYDCKLGTMTDRKLAGLVGTSVKVISHRRELFCIEVWSINQLIKPYRHMFDDNSDLTIARICGASVKSVTTYRRTEGLAPFLRPDPLQRRQRLPLGHPVRPFRQLLGLVPDEDVSRLSGVDVESIASIREAFGLHRVLAADPQPGQQPGWHDFHGPWLGFESLLGSMSNSKISRAVNVPISVVEQRRLFLRVQPYRRVSKLEQYRHLFGLVPNNLIAMLAGVSPTRVAAYIKQISEADKKTATGNFERVK
ncbi:hypothetical protein [Pseudomonas cannabina]|uniref:Uncharacterized protein n=1 Tax=Pseudomonas cannabina TaxID=86840 RepID=A0A0P9M6N0_PSECA|nr:hypothetical protein [Pseudomonas cannabina]KPW79399.1 hypothetical protein ALO81_200065 [Pseudomonas cannabina]SDR54432.1 hypothetical protein SAMN05216597_5689 [Pseudomonas cannabina]